MALNMTDPFPLRPWQLTAYIFIATSGFLGNLLVFIAIRRIKALKESSFGVYLGSLAAADILVSLSCLPVYLTSTSAFKGHPTGAHGDAFCKIISGYNVLFFFATVSVYTLVALSFERYLVICHPFYSQQYVSPKRAKMVNACIWGFAVILGIPSVLGENYAPAHEATIGSHCTFSSNYTGSLPPKVVYLMVFTVQYIVPVCLMIFCFVRIHSQLLAEPDPRIVESMQQHEAVQERNRNRRKSVVTVMIVIISYFSCWSMNQIIYFCYNFHLTHISWNANVVQVSVILCFLSSCLNPLIYAFRSKQFRHELEAILCCWKVAANHGGYQRLR